VGVQVIPSLFSSLDYRGALKLASLCQSINAIRCLRNIMNKEMKLYNENGKMIEGNWKLCKEIVLEYDKINPFEHDEIVKDTVQQLVKKYNVDYDDVVKNVELLSGMQL
tara:strand:- start:85 stop:411 length:327 start_codon:yes stop_codon:yes gene_type:complete